MKVTAYTTHKILPGEAILSIIDRYLPKLPNQSILVITSKIISVCQNQLISTKKVKNKTELIQQEADYFLPGDYQEQYGICLTLKNGILLPTAGIDHSNGQEHYILYPKDIPATAQTIWTHLKNKHQLDDLGVLITDSHSTPLRRGVTGIALGWCGFQPLFSYLGKPDVFGDPIHMTQMNIIDALATSAVFCMGEGDEQTPLALIEDAPKITFQKKPPTAEELASTTISLSEDLYAPLLNHPDWIKSKDPLPA